MPVRSDIKKIMIIGSGPIVIGQGCEFDYSGVQACKALKKEGFEIVLVNSNPATIMTDPGFADRTYLEPLTADILHEIIRRERPDAVLPTLGGQTALNLAVELYEEGVLARYGVELIGADAACIRRAEDRLLFKRAMKEAGIETAGSGSAHTLQEALAVAETLGSWPLIIRPGFTLGGTGGGIAENRDEFEKIVSRGLALSGNCEVLIEESLLGWKEYEMEVVRDKTGNAVIICSIENFDPMGIHTGDSITVAPAQTLSDAEYQSMRRDSLKIMEAIGVTTGGSNVQWAVNPKNGRRVVIEMNPRVSRSSALASKATGYPIAKIAVLLAVGYTLDEIRNDITGNTPACFEPAIDYVVVKIPRFAFEKFPKSDAVLSTQMKSVGETMALGSTFKEAFQKALRSLETGRSGYGADGGDTAYEKPDDGELDEKLKLRLADRIFYVRAAFRRGWTVEKVAGLTSVDPYFLRHLRELALYEDEIKSAVSPAGLEKNPELFRQAKELGFSDAQIAFLLGSTEAEVRRSRKRAGIEPHYFAVDTCAGEFEAKTPYFFSSYFGSSEPAGERKGKRSVAILGGGPNRIGQGIEFDYCCVYAAFALKRLGYESVMINSNPETVSTDYDMSDRLYFEPLTFEDVMNVYERENCYGAIVQLGGQTPLNLAGVLSGGGVNILGTPSSAIDLAEDRERFKVLASECGIKQPESEMAGNCEEAIKIASKIGYPVLVRPSFVLGGRGMAVAYGEEKLREYVRGLENVSDKRPVLVDRFLDNATELDVDCVSDGSKTIVGGVMEHVEQAGVHSGDSASVIPPVTLSEDTLLTVKSYAKKLARRLGVAGLLNVQFAVRNGEVYVIEANPRASRTVPFVSKATGFPLAAIAVGCMLGLTLEEQGAEEEPSPLYTSVKEAVFPFARFPEADAVLSPEMRSTGEVMGIDANPGLAYLKSQLAAGNALPEKGNVFVSFKDQDKNTGTGLVRELAGIGFKIYATQGTSTMLYDEGIRTEAVFRISKGRPNILDLLKESRIDWIITTAEGEEEAVSDEMLMRSAAIAAGIPITTTLAGAAAAVQGICEKRGFGRFEVCSLQEYRRKRN